MARRTPARFLAPLALGAAIVAVLAILAGSTGGGGQAEPTAQPTGTAAGGGSRTTGGRSGQGTGTTGTGASATSTTPKGGKRTYTVRPGDTLGSIAERTGVPVDQLQALNPQLDPQSLTVGQRIKLTGTG